MKGSIEKSVQSVSAVPPLVFLHGFSNVRVPSDLYLLKRSFFSVYGYVVPVFGIALECLAILAVNIRGHSWQAM